MALFSKWNWLNKMVLLIVILCLTNKTEATEKSMNKRVSDIKLSFKIWESFDKKD
jgi:hypothetical protein